MANTRRPNGPKRGKAPLPKYTKEPLGSFQKTGKLVGSKESKTTTIHGLQAHSLTYRSKKIKITLWKPNLKKYDDEDNTED